MGQLPPFDFCPLPFFLSPARLLFVIPALVSDVVTSPLTGWSFWMLLFCIWWLPSTLGWAEYQWKKVQTMLSMNWKLGRDLLWNGFSQWLNGKGSAMQETWVQFLGQEDPLAKGMATHSSYSCLENSMGKGAWQAAVCGVAKNWTQLSDQDLHFAVE